jgi:hypothetical protein
VDTNEPIYIHVLLFSVFSVPLVCQVSLADLMN